MLKYPKIQAILNLLFITMLFCGIASAQDQTVNGDVTVFNDEFTGKYAIAVSDSTLLSRLDKDREEERKSYVIPFFGGDIYDEDLTELAWTERWRDDFMIVLIREKPENYFFKENGTQQIPFLIDESRLSRSANYFKRSSKEIIEITFTSSEWENIIQSENSRYRINGQVFNVDQNTKNLMEQILREYERIQGEQNTSDRSAPYELQWEGDLERSPIVQPMPSNQTNEEGIITLRFEVHPDGSIGRVIPLRKMNPEMEREVMRTLRSWRFSRLPSGVPQESQWGQNNFSICYRIRGFPFFI